MGSSQSIKIQLSCGMIHFARYNSVYQKIFTFSCSLFLYNHSLSDILGQATYGTWCISKKHFRPGGMAPSECTRSVRAVRDTPVADYSAPGVKNTRGVTYHLPIADLPFLLALSVPSSNQNSGVVANCDHTSDWVHWVHACIGIAMPWVTLRKSLLMFLLH